MSSVRDPLFGCELAHGRRDRGGYVYSGKTLAHVAAWTAVHGPVPEGMVLDHGCCVRSCQALHHIECVTQSENLKRRDWRYRLKIKLCPKGLHDLKLNGVVMPNHGRVCRQCNREASHGRD